MFKSLQVKLVTIFVLIVLAIMTVAGTFLVLRVSDFYHESFYSQRSSVFQDGSISRIKEPDELDEALKKKSADIGISNWRNYYIVNADDRSIVYASHKATTDVYLDSDNFIGALSGATGDRKDATGKYLDYAVPVKCDGGLHIVYIKDTKEVEKFFNDTVKVLD